MWISLGQSHCAKIALPACAAFQAALARDDSTSRALDGTPDGTLPCLSCLIDSTYLPISKYFQHTLGEAGPVSLRKTFLSRTHSKRLGATLLFCLLTQQSSADLQSLAPWVSPRMPSHTFWLFSGYDFPVMVCSYTFSVPLNTKVGRYAKTRRICFSVTRGSNKERKAKEHTFLFFFQRFLAIKVM